MPSEGSDACVVVAGAGGDIGGALVGSLLEVGHSVVAIDRDVSALERLQSRTAGSVVAGLLTVEGDATSAESWRECLARASAAFGNVGGLCNAVGWPGSPARVEEFDPTAFREVVDVNVGSVSAGMAACFPHFRENGGGAVVNIASYAGLRGVPLYSSYAAAKHAVVGLTRSAAVEWARFDVRVNALCPGPTLGKMMSEVDDRLEALTGRPRQQRIVANIPLRRFASPAEVASAAAWLLSEHASYVTGAVWSIDGGASAV